MARYKLPKAFRFRDAIVRSPAGKADYRWAKEQAALRRVIRSTSVGSARPSDTITGTRTDPRCLATEGRTHMLNRSGDDLGNTGTLVAAPCAV